MVFTLAHQEQLQRELAQWGITLADNKFPLLLDFASFMLEENQRQNLTRITEADEVITRHLVDSLAILQWVEMDKQQKLLDLGSGGGFPGIPLAILYPELEVTLVDSERKKVEYLTEVARKFNLNRLRAVHARAEELGHERDHREAYQIVVSRSVANLPVLLEYTLPLTVPGGCFWAFKGDTAQEEALRGGKAAEILGGTIKPLHSYQLSNGSIHYLIEVHKSKNTPRSYPRKPGIPKKKPLL